MPSMSDDLASKVRTVVPIAIGAVVGWVAAWLAARGLDMTETDRAELQAVLMFATGAVSYVVGRRLERVAGDASGARLARGIGRFLVSLGIAPAMTAIAYQTTVEDTAKHRSD